MLKLEKRPFQKKISLQIRENRTQNMQRFMLALAIALLLHLAAGVLFRIHSAYADHAPKTFPFVLVATEASPQYSLEVVAEAHPFEILPWNLPALQQPWPQFQQMPKEIPGISYYRALAHD